MEKEKQHMAICGNGINFILRISSIGRTQHFDC